MSTPLNAHPSRADNAAATDLGSPATPPASPENRPSRDRARQSSRAFLVRLGVGALVGGGLGFAYYYFVGCNNGQCIIGANPFLSALFGGMFGFSLSAMLFPVPR